MTDSTRPGACGVILPPPGPGNPGESTLLPQTASELGALGLSPREVAFDGRVGDQPSGEQLADIAPGPIFVARRTQFGSRGTRRRLVRYCAGIEDRFSHLKRGYRLGRSRLKGHEGRRTWSGWRCSPTTSTPSPSTPAERPLPLTHSPARAHKTSPKLPRRPPRRGRFTLSAVYPVVVASPPS
jgi:hypothetical protein